MGKNVVMSNIEINYNDEKIVLSTKYKRGNSELVVFIHGLGCSKDSFSDVWNFKEFEKYSILTFDLVGFGDSSKSNVFSYEINEQAKICKLLLDKFKHTKIHVVAHSMGGAVGVLLTQLIKDRLVSFVSIEGNLIGEDCKVSRKTSKIPFEKFKNSVFYEFKSKALESKSFESRLWGKMFEKCDPESFYKSAKSLVKWSESNELLKIFCDLKVNKAYIYGEKNSNMLILKKLNNIKKVCISKGAHFNMNENPKEFYKKLYEILNQNEQA